MSKECLKARAIAAAENDELAADWRKEHAQYATVIRELVARVAELEAQLAAAPQAVQPVAYLRFMAWQGSGSPETGPEYDEGFEVCTPSDKGSDGSAAFPVYAHPTTQGLDAQDAVRLMFVMQDIDGFEGIARDKYDYAQSCATENGRDEPIEADELNGLRRLIDAALAAQAKQGEQA